MKQEDFNKFVEYKLDRISKMLIQKGQEYSKIDNKLHNFDKAGRMSNQTREKALLGMLLKHQVSVDDIVEDLETKLPTYDLIEEKITDILNYYILLHACIVDRIEKSEKD